MEKLLDKLDRFQTQIADRLSGFESPSDVPLTSGPKERHLQSVYPSPEVQKEIESYLETLNRF